ncbi:hypothetical protein ACWCPQ_20355 [Nocardia sp. NPDC001965]
MCFEAAGVGGVGEQRVGHRADPFVHGVGDVDRQGRYGVQQVRHESLGSLPCVFGEILAGEIGDQLGQQRADAHRGGLGPVRGACCRIEVEAAQHCLAGGAGSVHHPRR